MWLFLASLLFLLVGRATSLELLFKLRHFTARAIGKSLIAVALIAPPQSYADELDIPASTPRTVLTARDLLKNDVSMRTEELSRILFTLRLSEQQLETSTLDKSAAFIRTRLRTEPVKSLRLTCKSLRKYLPSPEIQRKFDIDYEILIDSLSNVDSWCLREMQGEQVTREDIQVALKAVFGAMERVISMAAAP